VTTAADATWKAYLVRCADGSLYAGVSNDVAKRVAAHNAGTGARYTRARRPVALAWSSPKLGKSAAHRLEARLKRLSRADKLLIADGRGRSVVRRLLAQVRAADQRILASSSDQRA
jgi:putative endonuclease